MPHRFLRAALAVVAAPAFLCAAVPSAGSVPYHGLQPERPVVALAPGLEGDAFLRTLNALEAEGIHVPVAYPGAGFILIGRSGLAAQVSRHGLTLLTTEADAEPFRTARSGDPRTGSLLRWWEDGFRAPAVTPEERRAREAALDGVQICAGAEEVAELAAARSARCGPGEFGQVHFAAGRCVVNLIRPQQAGAVQYLWSGPDIEKVGAELVRALMWWNLKTGRRLTFVVEDHGTVRTQTEAALAGINGEASYIGECLTSLGYTQTTCAYAQLNELNTAMRERYQGHWGVTQFILNAESFPGSGALAYAYLGGPHTVALRGNGVLSVEELDHVIAHEFGHIFQAVDEYASGCSGCNAGPYGYLNARNGNCVSCPTQEGSCVMRGAGEYSLHQMHEMEQFVEPCRFTRQMTGIWDGDGDGIWDVLETEPETVITTDVPDTVDSPQSFRLEGVTWDQPYPAPAKYPEPVTINRIRAVEFRVDGGPPRDGRGLDGLLTDQEEEFEIPLPPMGGGPHFILVQGVNTAGIRDQSPARVDFFVYDVVLRQDLELLQDERDTDGDGKKESVFSVSWQVEGEDFGSTYVLYRRRGLDGDWEAIAELPSQRGRNDRFVYWDAGIEAGREFLYKLEADIPGKGRKDLGTARREAVLAAPAPGSIVSIAPNPSRGSVLFSVTVPRGPRPDQPDVLFPDGFGGTPGFRDEEDTPGGTQDNTLLWRDVDIKVYDVRGRAVQDLGRYRAQETRSFNAGWDGTYADGRRVPAGVYFIRVSLGYAETIEKVVMVR